MLSKEGRHALAVRVRLGEKYLYADREEFGWLRWKSDDRIFVLGVCVGKAMAGGDIVCGKTVPQALRAVWVWVLQV